MDCRWPWRTRTLSLNFNLTKNRVDFQTAMGRFLLILLLCQIKNVTSQRIDRISCERKPTHTSALKTPGDNGFSIKILGSPPVTFYKPGHNYQVLLNGSYANQQFLDFMLVAVLKSSSNERQSAGSFVHTFNHMTKEDPYCSHIMTSVTFHPSYKKSTASFTWTAPPAGSGCVLFKATVLEHPDIWFSDDGGLTKMFCEEPTNIEEVSAAGQPTSNTQESANHKKRQSSQCCACDVAKYELTFVGNWSRETHPKDFPSTQYESLLHWSDIIGASHSPSYSVWSYGSIATTGVKEVCEYGWPRTLEGEIKQQSRNVRTVIKTSGVWGYPNIYTTKKSARFSTDNSRPLVSLLTMIGPSPDWCVGIDSVNMCLENCTWLDSLDLELFPWDAGTDSGVTYLSSNLPTYPKDVIKPITNEFPNNTASPFYGTDKVSPMATVRIRRVGAKTTPTSTERCEASSSTKPTFTDSDAEEILNVPDVKCMVTEWSEFDACSVTCGVGTKTRTRQFKSPMGSTKACPKIKLQEIENCLGLVNECEVDPSQPVDVCITTPWSLWSPCTATCGSGVQIRTRRYLNQMGPLKCSTSLEDTRRCQAEVADCSQVNPNWSRVCREPLALGSCVGNFTRYFYDVDMGKCRHFEYTGCRGNANNFDTLEDCVSSCGTVEGGSPVAAGDVDCMLTEWSAFSSCSVTCGTGLKSRSRQIKRRNSGNGAMCPKSTTQTEVCTLDDCPAPSPTSDVDCMLSEWSAWSLCSETCGDGVQARQRMVKRPAQGQGQPCDPNVKEMRSCNLSDCHPYCMLSPWGDWSKCSVACGVGKRMRRRMEKRGPCPVDTQYTEMEPCQGSLCQDANCVISEWTAWTPCDALCGVMGTQTRFRMIVQPASEGGTCPLSDPKEMEMRACYNGPCTDATSTTESTQENLPVDCQVGDWGEWSACSKSCGTGRQVRRRSVTIKRKNHGARCPPLKEVQHCDNAVKCRRRQRRRRA